MWRIVILVALLAVMPLRYDPLDELRDWRRDNWPRLYGYVYRG